MTETSTLTLATLAQKNIIVLGAGLTGLSCVRFFALHNINCAVNDNRENAVELSDFKKEFPNTACVLGRWEPELLAAADLVIVSPGIDVEAQGIKAMLSVNCLLIGDVELFCLLNNSASESSIPLLAVTGSNGKSTVVSLLSYLGEVLGYKVALGGNIGVPVLTQLSNTLSSGNKLDCLILELSSFQLETMTSMNALASSVLNVSDDHLDRHHNIENYKEIKHRIYAQAKVNVFNRDDVLTTPKLNRAKGRSNSICISFGSDEPEAGDFGLSRIDGDLWLMHGGTALIAMKSLPIAGVHNAMNCLSAFALGMQAGWSLKEMVNAVSGFQGLSHRCQLVNTSGNIQWINDSKATNVGATLAALEGLLPSLADNNKLILIAGGDGKGAEFSPLKPLLAQENIELITLGKDGNAIAELNENAQRVNSMLEAVAHADKQAKSGDIVLLSPACASIDMFKNYLERGDKYVEAIEQVLLATTTNIETNNSAEVMS